MYVRVDLSQETTAEEVVNSDGSYGRKRKASALAAASKGGDGGDGGTKRSKSSNGSNGSKESNGVGAEKRSGTSHLLKLLPKYIREPKREPGTIAGDEYCSFNNETPEGIAGMLGCGVAAFVALNAVVYVGLKKDSKLQRGTIMMVPNA